MSLFSVVLLTAPPTGCPADWSGPFIKIDGRESVLRCVELFLNRDNIKQIQLVVPPAGIEEARKKHGAHLGFSGVKLVAGGPRWIDQLAAAANTLAAECSHVIVHDAARPAVPYTDLEALMAAADKKPVALAAPLRTPLVEVDDGGAAVAFHPVARYQQLLWPQLFSKPRFLDIAKTRTEPHPSEFALLPGSPLNLRVNASTDGALIKAMLGLLPRPKMRGPATPFDEAQW